MREFTININESFVNGLRPDERVDRNSTFLTQAKNVVCRETGLEEYIDIVDPFEGNLPVNFPFPILYRGNFLSLLMSNNSIGKVDESTFPWSVDYYSLSSFIPEGGVWQVMDLNNSFYLFNGRCIVAKLPDEDALLVNTEVEANSGINFRGRPIIGGVRASEVWTEEWENIFYYWQEHNEHLPGVIRDKPDKSYVMWGTIGGGDFPLWLFKPEILTQGHIDYGFYEDIAEDSFLINQLKMSQFGFMPMPFQGDVLTIKELGKGFMVYGEDGIVYMPHFDGRTVGDDQIPPTFGIQNVTSVGIANRGAVGGTKDFHVFMDSGGDLWSINAELSLKKLGYKEFLFDMLSSDDIVISFDSHETEFYITDGNDSYMLSKGLSRIRQGLTSLSYTQGGNVGLFSDAIINSSNEVDVSSYITTTTFDMNIRGVKTIVNVNLGYTVDNSIAVAIQYRYNSNETFKTTKLQTVNKEGVAYVRVSGVEFRLIIFASRSDGLTLDYANIRWQADDKRNVRGLGAVQNTSGGN